MTARASRWTWAAAGATTVTLAWWQATGLGPAGAAALAGLGGCLLGAALALASRDRRATRLDVALRRRDDRLAETAHELRTPLAAMQSALEVVRGGYAQTPEEIEGFLDEADLAARHLAFLINDVLDEAALDSGRLRLELREHAVGPLLGEAARMLGMQAARNQVVIQLGGNERCVVRADARRTLQVLFNLVGNAVKHTDPGAAILIEVEDAGEQIRIRVLDEGPGVAATVRPQLFQAFAGDDGHARADSTGLGLYICRRLVEQMGGEIGYRPRHPRGSEFWFTLPRVAHAAIEPAAVEAQ
ncbi:MAG: HAMP domain-containing histidine kinase [Planctomycetes bacterium]|nr:HAMP domain-containing histidine kinase [Planctomycetota bacterium]